MTYGRTAHMPGSSRNTRHGPLRSMLPAAPAVVVAIVILSLAASWPAWARQSSAAAGPSLVVVPASGPPGTTVSLSALQFQREADLADNTITFTFDTTNLPRPTISSCTANPGLGFGFGDQCTGQAYQYAIPLGTAAGTHTFHIVVSQMSPTGAAQVLDDASASFQVTSVATETPTITATPPAVTSTASPTATGTAAATSTATASATATATTTATATAPPATGTSTPLPSSPTATSTPRPNTPTAVPPKPTAVLPVVALVRPDFNRDTVAIVVRAAAGSKVHVDFAILVPSTGSSTKQAFSASQNGVTGALGLFSYNLKIHFPAHTSGTATLSIKETGPGGTKALKRAYRYRVAG